MQYDKNSIFISRGVILHCDNEVCHIFKLLKTIVCIKSVPKRLHKSGIATSMVCNSNFTARLSITFYERIICKENNLMHSNIVNTFNIWRTKKYLLRKLAPIYHLCAAWKPNNHKNLWNVDFVIGGVHAPTEFLTYLI